MSDNNAINCPKCGYQVTKDATFCPWCKAQIQQEHSVPNRTKPQNQQEPAAATTINNRGSATNPRAFNHAATHNDASNNSYQTLQSLNGGSSAQRSLFDNEKIVDNSTNKILAIVIMAICAFLVIFDIYFLARDWSYNFPLSDYAEDYENATNVWWAIGYFSEILGAIAIGVGAILRSKKILAMSLLIMAACSLAWIIQSITCELYFSAIGYENDSLAPFVILFLFFIIAYLLNASLFTKIRIFSQKNTVLYIVITVAVIYIIYRFFSNYFDDGEFLSYLLKDSSNFWINLYNLCTAGILVTICFFGISCTEKAMQPYQQQPYQQANDIALKRTIENIHTLGIVSIFGAIFISLVGLICGIIGISKANSLYVTAEYKDNLYRAKNLNIIGIAISIVGFVIQMIYFSTFSY